MAHRRHLTPIQRMNVIDIIFIKTAHLHLIIAKKRNLKLFKINSGWHRTPLRDTKGLGEVLTQVSPGLYVYVYLKWLISLVII